MRIIFALVCLSLTAIISCDKGGKSDSKDGPPKGKGGTDDAQDGDTDGTRPLSKSL